MANGLWGWPINKSVLSEDKRGNVTIYDPNLLRTGERIDPGMRVRVLGGLTHGIMVLDIGTVVDMDDDWGEYIVSLDEPWYDRESHSWQHELRVESDNLAFLGKYDESCMIF